MVIRFPVTNTNEPKLFYYLFMEIGDVPDENESKTNTRWVVVVVRSYKSNTKR